MIHVEHHIIIGDLDHLDRECLSTRSLHVNGLSNRQIVNIGHVFPWDALHELLVALAISISRRNMNLLGLAHSHLVHRCIEAGNHHARHAGELQRFAALDRRVEHRTVIERTNIVNAYLFSFVAHIVSFHEENRIISADLFARFLFVRVV